MTGAKRVLARNSIKVCFVWPTTSCIWIESIIIVECFIVKRQWKTSCCFCYTFFCCLYLNFNFFSLSSILCCVHTLTLRFRIWNEILCRNKFCIGTMDEKKFTFIFFSCCRFCSNTKCDYGKNVQLTKCSISRAYIQFYTNMYITRARSDSVWHEFHFSLNQTEIKKKTNQLYNKLSKTVSLALS